MAELNLKQITDKLNSEFTGEVRKLVFWYDANAEFMDDVDAMELVNAKVLHLEPDSDVVKETAYRLCFIDEDGQIISNQNLFVADKKNKDTTERIFRLKFSFKNKRYDKTRKYYLVAYDVNTSLETLRHEVVMDIIFADDFGF